MVEFCKLGRREVVILLSLVNVLLPCSCCCKGGVEMASGIKVVEGGGCGIAVNSLMVKLKPRQSEGAIDGKDGSGVSSRSANVNR